MARQKGIAGVDSWRVGLMASKMFLGIPILLLKAAFPRRLGDDPPTPERRWWQKPGLGLMYQIEFRPGWGWERDFTEFNRSMQDEQSGALKFNGPFCKIADWVALTRAANLDYHVFEIKWHDGICYFNTRTTKWKTPEDYAGEFARLSRSKGIPFMFYYSTVFDHNPELDPIQPNPHATMSFIGMREDDAYIQYLYQHFGEILEQYHPDGMWFDIYFQERSTQATIEYFRQHAPDVVITFNGSNLYLGAAHQLHYTTSEVHDLDGPLMRTVMGIPVPSSCWRWANIFKGILRQPWELVTPVGRFWQDPALRDDEYDLVRMGAITMACGGKLCMGATALLSGEIHPDQMRQIRLLGEWYGPRHQLFTEAVPITRGRVHVQPTTFKTLTARTADALLVHVINMKGERVPVEVGLVGRPWQEAQQVRLEPTGREVKFRRSSRGLTLRLNAEDVDIVDTILSIRP